MRVDDTAKALGSDGRIPAEKINLSTFAIFSNFLVTKESLSNNPLIGSGIGTHALNYDKYIGIYFSEDNIWREMELNREDANSLMLRLLSETGIIGAALFLLFILHYSIPYKEHALANGNNYYLWMINNGILASIILRLVRFGNYTVLGFPFFLLLFIFSYRYYKINTKPAVNSI